MLRTELSERDRPSRSQPFHSHMVQNEKARADPTSVMSTLMTSCDPQAGHFDEA